MGAATSKQEPMAQSPSAAFGRLRIDSPASRSIRFDKLTGSTRSVRNLRRHPAGTATTESSPLVRLESVDSDLALGKAAPPFAVWIGPALVCALCYALYNIFIKKGSASIHPVLGGVILQFVAALVGSVLLIALVFNYEGGVSDLPCDRTGIFWAVWAGVAVGSAEILSFIVSGMGVQAMQSIPIIIGGSVLFGTTLGFFLLKEALTYRGWLGVVLIAAGIALVGTDPGGAGSVH
jgi:bacterial/archaeal transporter family protein